MRKRKAFGQQVLDGWISKKTITCAKSNKKSFIDCPACNKLVSLQFVDQHLESECQQLSKKVDSQVQLKEESCGWEQKTSVVAYRVRKRQKQGLDAEQLRALAPCSVVKGVLSHEMAEGLLRSTYDQAQCWGRGTWWMFGQKRIAPRASAYYTLTHDQDEQNGVINDEMSGESCKQIKLDETPDILMQATQVIQEKVNEFENGKDWKPTYVLANYYKDGQDSVGQHSDRLTRLGPLPIIASLSLGASRVFRIKRPKQTTRREGGGEFNYIDIPLEHNTLVIMWQGMQEEWLHEVPKSTNIKTKHPISQFARINLTFRQLKTGWQKLAPECRCGRQTVMKTKPLQESQQGQHSFEVLGCVLPKGRYYYLCDNTQGPGCGFFKKLEVYVQEKNKNDTKIL